MSNILPAVTPAPDFTLHAKPDHTLTLKGGSSYACSAKLLLFACSRASSASASLSLR